MLAYMKLVLVALAVLSVFVAAILLWGGSPLETSTPEHIFCAGGTLTCPDGSTVFRMPPDCEFAVCPVVGE